MQKINKFWNCLSIRHSAPLGILPILLFALWYKWVVVNVLNNQMENDQYFEISKFRILKERKIRYSISLFSNLLFIFIFIWIILRFKIYDNL